MQFDAHQIQAALREHYRAKLGATPFRVSDIGYIGEGIGNYMFAFRLVVAEGGSQTEQQLILRLGQNAEARLREFQALDRQRESDSRRSNVRAASAVRPSSW